MQKALTEKEAEDFLEKQGFSVVKRMIISKAEQLIEAEKNLPYPWVMKVSSSKIAHKAKLGGVITNITSQLKAQEAFEKLSKIEGFQEAIIQETLSGEEAIIGIKKTPEFGQVIMFGKGGSKVEEEKDVSFRVLPAANQELEELMKETHFYKKLEDKQVNLKILKKYLANTAKLAKRYPNLIELDINPLFINAQEAKAADVRIILEE
jgi:succinyl-CoA synthetase beta subunit